MTGGPIFPGAHDSFHRLNARGGAKPDDLDRDAPGTQE